MAFNRTPAGSGPCKGCDRREVGCHADCIHYLAWKADIEAEREAAQEGRAFREYLHESKAKILKRQSTYTSWRKEKGGGK